MLPKSLLVIKFKKKSKKPSKTSFIYKRNKMEFI